MTTTTIKVSQHKKKMNLTVITLTFQHPFVQTIHGTPEYCDIMCSDLAMGLFNRLQCAEHITVDTIEPISQSILLRFTIFKPYNTTRAMKLYAFLVADKRLALDSLGSTKLNNESATANSGEIVTWILMCLFVMTTCFIVYKRHMKRRSGLRSTFPMEFTTPQFDLADWSPMRRARLQPTSRESATI